MKKTPLYRNIKTKTGKAFVLHVILISIKRLDFQCRRSPAHHCTSKSCQIFTCTFSFSRGAGPKCNTKDYSDKLYSVQEELEELARKEAELDQHKMWVQQSIKNVTDEVSNTRYPFIVCQYLKILKYNLTPYHTVPTFIDLEQDAFRKHCGKRRKCW